MSSPQGPVGLSLPGANPKKRPSNASTPQQSSQQTQQTQPAKRPRVQHPLAQTSFPAEEGADPRVYTARSEVDGDVESLTGVSVSESIVGSLDGRVKGKKKRGRKAKGEKGEDGSVKDGSVLGGRGGRSVTGSMRVGEEDEDEELVDEGDAELLGGEDAAADAITEKENLAILIDAFNDDQSSRYDMFKRTKLNKPTLRKIVNQTLSQSVPPAVITTVSGFTKVFIGEMIEKARTVAAEWAEAADSLAIEEMEKAEREEKEREEQRKAVQAREEAEKREEAARQAASSATNGAAETSATSTPGPAGTTPSPKEDSNMPNGDAAQVKPESNAIPRQDTDGVKPEAASQENGIQSIPLHKPQQEQTGAQTQPQIASSFPGIQSQRSTPQPQAFQPQQRQHQSPYAQQPPKIQPQPQQFQQQQQQPPVRPIQTQQLSQSQSFNQLPPSTQSTVADTPPESPSKKTRRLPPNPHRGPLMPSHLREALRRNKRAAEGGNVGFSGLSMNGYGVKGSLSWTVRGGGGRRLFK